MAGRRPQQVFAPLPAAADPSPSLDTFRVMLKEIDSLLRSMVEWFSRVPLVVWTGPCSLFVTPTLRLIQTWDRTIHLFHSLEAGAPTNSIFPPMTI